MKYATLRRVAALLAAAWFGLGAGLGLVAAPVLFATIDRNSAGSVAARLFAVDAAIGAVLGALLLVAARVAARQDVSRGGSQINAESMLALGGLFCILAGHYAIQPLVAAARTTASSGPSFAVLHGVASVFFLLKLAMAAALAWRWSRISFPTTSS